ncbi:MAG TPA: DUF5989 family protein [archaeon]|nr:DUF5989 family protein [archaeon]HLD81426.1 DUF5989 family protein [archaeon]
MAISDSLKEKKDSVSEVFEFLWERKAWWLAPIVLVLLLVGALIIITQSSALSPFIYPLL